MSPWRPPKDGKDRYTTEIVGEKMQMLSGKGEGGSQGQGQRQGGGRGYQQEHSQGSYEEPVFNPDDEIPF